MRVLFLAPGSSTHTEKWVNTLAAKGVDVHLVYIAGHEPVEGHISPSVKTYCLSRGGGKAYFLCGAELRKLASQIAPDVVNAHYGSGYGTLARMADIHPLATSFWGSDIYEFPYKSIINRKIIEKNIRKADYVISTSHCMADEIRKVMKDSSMEIGITPFGIDTELFCPKGKESEEIIVGTVKALEPVYRIDLLIDAFAIALKMADEKLADKLKLKIYGDGSCREALETKIKDLGLEGRATLEGKIPNTEVPKALEEMALFCAFSEKESFGVAIIEAMAMKVATLASSAEGFCEVMDDGVTGVIVRSDEAQAYADKMLELLLDNDRREAMGEAGRERVKKLYDWDSNVDTMIEIYKKAAWAK